MLKKYTLGVAFDHDSNIVLIKKNKPEWQAGMLNFVGGKVERGEKPQDCMAREFREETGVEIPPEQWRYVGTMKRNKDFIVYIYTTVHPNVANVRTTTDEEIFKISTEQFEISSKIRSSSISNIRTIYEFIRSDDFINQGSELNVFYKAK